MRVRYVSLCTLTVVGAFTLPVPTVCAQSPDPIATKKQVTELLDAHYAEEERKLKAEIDRRKQNEILYLTGKHLSEVKKALADKKQIPPIVPVAATPPDPCQPGQTVFVRRNSLDTFQLGYEPVAVADAKGASVNFTQDQLTNTNTVTVNGRVQAILLRHDALSTCVDGKVRDPWATADVSVPQLSYAIAPFVDGQGTTSSPQKKGETSALQTGVDVQLSLLGGPVFDHQYLTLTPYYQTDFRGAADIQGFTAFWEPIAPDVHLGGRLGVPDQYVDWFWQFRAVYDERHVTSPGVTGLTNRSYQWAGAVAQAHLVFFPDLSAFEPSWQAPFPALLNRLFLNGVINYYWDANSGKSIHLFEAELGYNITPDGKSSISVKYDRGTDKDTLQAMQKYLIALNYKL